MAVGHRADRCWVTRQLPPNTNHTTKSITQTHKLVMQGIVPPPLCMAPFASGFTNSNTVNYVRIDASVEDTILSRANLQGLRVAHTAASKHTIYKAQMDAVVAALFPQHERQGAVNHYHAWCREHSVAIVNEHNILTQGDDCEVLWWTTEQLEQLRAINVPKLLKRLLPLKVPQTLRKGLAPEVHFVLEQIGCAMQQEQTLHRSLPTRTLLTKAAQLIPKLVLANLGAVDASSSVRLSLFKAGEFNR